MWFSIYVVLHASAQPGLDGQRVIPERVIEEGTAEGQQASFQGQLGTAALLRCGVGEGRGLAVKLVNGGGPLGQWRIIGVAGAQVVDVAHQVGPAALLGAVVTEPKITGWN